MNNAIKMFIINWVWQLPQHVLGLLVLLFFRLRCGKDGDTIISHNWNSEYLQDRMRSIVLFINMKSRSFTGAFSLGNFVFIHKDKPHNVLFHELGHSVQSRKLGWLYLPVVALPSVCNNIYFRLFDRSILKHSDNSLHVEYYRRYPENWANRIVRLNADDLIQAPTIEQYLKDLLLHSHEYKE